MKLRFAGAKYTDQATTEEQGVTVIDSGTPGPGDLYTNLQTDENPQKQTDKQT